MTRYNLSTPRESKDGKTYWTKIGSAWPTKDGQGFSIVLDALPLNGKLLMSLPKDKSEYDQTPHNEAKANGYQPQLIPDDDIPF